MKILHVSDVHIDYYASYLGSMKLKDGVNLYHKERVERFRQIIKEGLEAGAEVIAITGDFHNRVKPPPQEYADVYEVFDSIPTRVPVFIIPGNHDEMTARGCALQPLVGRKPNIFPALQLTTINYKDVDFILAPWGTPYDAILTWCREAKESGNMQVLLYHAAVDGPNMTWGENEGEQGTVSVKQLKELGCDAIMLGHYHGQVALADNIWYAGSPECYNFGEVEQTKGYIMWEKIDKTILPRPVVKWDVTWAYEFETITVEELLTHHYFGKHFIRIVGQVTEEQRLLVLMEVRELEMKGSKVKLLVTNALADKRVFASGGSDLEILSNWLKDKNVSKKDKLLALDAGITKEIEND